MKSVGVRNTPADEAEEFRQTSIVQDRSKIFLNSVVPVRRLDLFPRKPFDFQDKVSQHSQIQKLFE